MRSYRRLRPLCFTLLFSACSALTAAEKPNFVIIFIDDMGYGDIEPLGSTVNATPNLSRMAAEGRTLTSFYVAAPVCTPSRAALQAILDDFRADIAENSRAVGVAKNSRTLVPRPGVEGEEGYRPTLSLPRTQ